MLLAEQLQSVGLDVVTEYEYTSYEKNIFNEIQYIFQSGDFVVILLSESLFHEYFHFKYIQNFFQQARQRKISIIPVFIEKWNVPIDIFEYTIINLATNFIKGIAKLIDLLKVMPDVLFDNFNHREYEELIYDLLKAYGFKNIQKEQESRDAGFDFVAEYFPKNPFGQKRKELWLIETKFYSKSRFDIKTIKQVIERYKYNNKKNANLLLITNSQLNTVVEEYLNDIRVDNNFNIEIIDGLLLKKLIANRKRIANKYFPK